MSNEYQTLLPDCDCKSGGIIMYNNKPVCRWCGKPYGNGGVMYYPPEHFEPSEPVKERVIVSHSADAGKFRNIFYTSSAIPKDKYKIVDAAIEKVLNEEGEYAPTTAALNDTVVEDGKFIELLQEELRELNKKLLSTQQELLSHVGKKYTQAEVDAIRKHSWDARNEIISPNNFILKYPTYEDYLSSLNTNDKELRGSLNISNNQEHTNDTGKEEKHKCKFCGAWTVHDDKYCFKNPDMKMLPEQPTNDNAFVWTDELVLLVCDYCHHNGWHKNGRKVVEEFDEFKKMYSNKYIVPDWIKKHLQSKQSAPVDTLPSKEYLKAAHETISSNNEDVACLSLNDVRGLVNWQQFLELEQKAKQKLNSLKQ